MRYHLSDEFDNEFATSDSYAEILTRAQRYMSAHRDAPLVTVFDEIANDEWTLLRADVLLT